MFSEVCIPLTTRCLRAPLLYIGGACSLARSHQPRFWCGRHRVPEGTRPAAFSAGSLIVKTAGSIRERLAGRHVGDPLACGEGLRLSTELSDRELGPCEGFPYEGLQRGLGGSLRASRYLGKNTEVIDGSLHISTLLFSFHIYIVCITPFCDRDSNTLAKP